MNKLLVCFIHLHWSLVLLSFAVLLGFFLSLIKILVGFFLIAISLANGNLFLFRVTLLVDSHSSTPVGYLVAGPLAIGFSDPAEVLNL